MRVTVSSKGQIALPAELRRRDAVQPGQEFEVERLGAEEYCLTRVAASNEGLVDWPAACPQKGYFVEVDPEPTDTL